MALKFRHVSLTLILSSVCLAAAHAQAQIASFQSKDNNENIVHLGLNGAAYSNLVRTEREIDFDSDGLSIMREVYTGTTPGKASEAIQADMVATAELLCQSAIDYTFSGHAVEKADVEMRYELEFTCD